MQDGNKIIRYFKHKSWPIYILNIVHITGCDADTWEPINNVMNLWNDALCIIRDDGDIVLSNIGTTDPGTYWENSPMNDEGCAIVAWGHHPNSHELGEHHGYPALVQSDSSGGKGIGGITIYRDKEANGIRRGTQEICYDCGINIHSGRGRDCEGDVDMYSAGCQVRKYWDSHMQFYNLMKDSGKRYFDLNVISSLELKTFKG